MDVPLFKPMLLLESQVAHQMVSSVVGMVVLLPCFDRSHLSDGGVTVESTTVRKTLKGPTNPPIHRTCSDRTQAQDPRRFV